MMLKAPELETYLAAQAERIEERLKILVPCSKAAYAPLFDAARYSLLSGGKRIRPILALAACESLGGDIDAVLTPACALEMIHTYSLIHDDLPCMDDDDFRRGKPTLHKVYPESVALLAGDYLLTRAFECLANAPGLSGELKIHLIQALSWGAGGDGMIGGQVLDIATDPSGIEDLEQIHRLKTGALMEASLTFGGIVAKASPEVLQELQIFGQEIGLAFQIVDDILDVTASEQKHGRKIASDVQNQKTTYVTQFGIDHAKAKADDLLETAVARLRVLPLNPQRLTQLGHLLVNRSI